MGDTAGTLIEDVLDRHHRGRGTGIRHCACCECQWLCDGDSEVREFAGTDHQGEMVAAFLLNAGYLRTSAERHQEWLANTPAPAPEPTVTVSAAARDLVTHIDRMNSDWAEYGPGDARNHDLWTPLHRKADVLRAALAATEGEARR